MSELSVEKSATINVPLEKVYAAIRDFRQWPAWSPWLITEPDCSVSYADDGKSYSWNGKIIGSGEIKITSEEPPHAIHCQLAFFKPWKSNAAVRFAFKEHAGGTEIIWSMKGSLPFFLFWMKPMMISLIELDYERGLNMLKDCLESGTVPSKLDFIGPNSQRGFRYIGTKTQCAIQNIGEQMDTDCQKLQSWLQANNLQPSGKCFSIYHQWDFVKRTTEYTIGFPIDSPPGNFPADLIIDRLPDCQVYSIKHTGAYRHLGNAWAAGYLRERVKIFAQNKKIPPFEIYENEPDATPENDLVTFIHFPIKIKGASTGNDAATAAVISTGAAFSIGGGA